IWWLVLAIISTWVLTRTQFGNWIFAVGGNAEAARNSGVPVNTVRIILFMWTAVCATILAMLQVFDLGSADV
ncbi:MAG: ABC transporter permease, partial [Desulfuromonadales bacterium]|nr:ABC transporter permease [Desulfuromonadales bacterium]NIS39856.1 ABC transporter permease [Desulfuromonadales bacterium]